MFSLQFNEGTEKKVYQARRKLLALAQETVDYDLVDTYTELARMLDEALCECDEPLRPARRKGQA